MEENTTPTTDITVDECQELKNIKYDIYSWLRKLDFNETSNFIKELKNPLILLLSIFFGFILARI
jgi:hypothetical protein